MTKLPRKFFFGGKLGVFVVYIVYCLQIIKIYIYIYLAYDKKKCIPNLVLTFFYTPMRSYKKEKENSKVFILLSETAFNQI